MSMLEKIINQGSDLRLMERTEGSSVACGGPESWSGGAGEDAAGLELR